eukprot:GHVT01002826.1.p1 GENE.GHVT01002826.1~~GHVT01002826.1.p1  ORF type:complete len:397 (-),score=65.86 GHVT01002826.1:1289-2479(-)
MASSLRLILSAAAVIVTSACVCVSSAEAPPSVGRHLQARDCKGTWSPWSECMPLEGHNSHHDQGDIWDLAEDKEASVQLCFKKRAFKARWPARDGGSPCTFRGKEIVGGTEHFEACDDCALIPSVEARLNPNLVKGGTVPTGALIGSTVLAFLVGLFLACGVSALLFVFCRRKRAAAAGGVTGGGASGVGTASLFRRGNSSSTGAGRGDCEDVDVEAASRAAEAVVHASIVISPEDEEAADYGGEGHLSGDVSPLDAPRGLAEGDIVLSSVAKGLAVDDTARVPTPVVVGRAGKDDFGGHSNANRRTASRAGSISPASHTSRRSRRSKYSKDTTRGEKSPESARSHRSSRTKGDRSERSGRRSANNSAQASTETSRQLSPVSLSEATSTSAAVDII